MRELKILSIVAVISLLIYIGVEPFAHSQMHKHVEGHDFVYNGKSDIDTLKEKIQEVQSIAAKSDKKEAKLSAKKEILGLNSGIEEKKSFWAHALKISSLKGDVAKGKVAIAACIGCHGIKSQGMTAPMDAVASSASYGVNPPDLSSAGALYDTNFLAAFILDPAHATFTKKSAMPAGLGGDDQNIADIIAYLKSIASKNIEPKVAFEHACGRCHAMRYANWTQIGTVPKTKSDIKTGQDIQMLKFKQHVAEYQNSLAQYMGKLPPDLSMIIRARSEKFLETFVENPQSQLYGTAMPRVGLTKGSYEKVREYLEHIGDPSRPKREAVGPWVIGFFIIFTIFAYLWKQYHWRELH